MSEKPMKYRETMWATMRPEPQYSARGEHLAPRWQCYADGDKDGEEGLKTLDLAAYTFPPGTKVVVSEPCCPKCGDLREPSFPKLTFAVMCNCGFNWGEWAKDQYS